MQWEDIEKLAKKQLIAPTKLNDLYAYELLRKLYDDYRSGTESLDNCKIRVKKIKSAWEEANAYYDIYSEYQNNIKKSESLRCAIGNSRDINEIASLAIECIKIITGDDLLPNTKYSFSQYYQAFLIADKFLNKWLNETPDWDLIFQEIGILTGNQQGFMTDLLILCTNMIEKEHKNVITRNI